MGESSNTPCSLDDTATPNQVKTYTLMKSVKSELAEQGEKSASHFAKSSDFMVASSEFMAKSNKEYTKAEEERKRAQNQRLDDDEQKAQDKVKAAQDEVIAARKNKADAAAKEKEKEVDEQKRKAELFQHELQMRSLTKSISIDQTKALETYIDKAVKAKEDDLDDTYDKGVVAGIDYQTTTAKATKAAAMARRFTGSAAVKEAYTVCENRTATVNDANTSTAPATFPTRRSERQARREEPPTPRA